MQNSLQCDTICFQHPIVNRYSVLTCPYIEFVLLILFCKHFLDLREPLKNKVIHQSILKLFQQLYSRVFFFVSEVLETNSQNQFVGIFIRALNLHHSLLTRSVKVFTEFFFKEIDLDLLVLHFHLI